MSASGPPELTYPEVGATRDRRTLPAGYHHLRHRRRIGGPETFDAAADFVLGFGMQRGAGFTVTSTTTVARPGAELVLRRWFGPVRITAPARVVYVLDEPDRRGFAYGTLPGHPESGEELFLVERLGTETWAEVRAFSRAGRWFTRVGTPVARVLQRRASMSYLDSVSGAVQPG